MSCDVGYDHDADMESLFGSPPPSPRSARGRSPELSLPIASSATQKTSQNVGTIALPGSHPHIERPPVYLPGPVTFPPPRPTSSTPEVRRPAAPPPILTSRAVSQPKPQVKKVWKRKAVSPSPPRPQIPLPGPDEPTPANFLRNQHALLGHAGLVGGVNPSRLAKRLTQGTSASNPIVIEEEPTRVLVLPRPVVQPRIGRYNPPTPVHVCPQPKATVPTNQEIFSVLVKDPKFKSLLQNLTRFLNSNQKSTLPSSSTSTTSRSSTEQPAKKKQKTIHVPAGAADWDIPFPFAPSEETDSYNAKWHNERGTALLAELVQLVKVAADKVSPQRRAKGKERTKQHTQPTQNSRVAAADIPSTVMSAAPSESALRSVSPTSLSHFESAPATSEAPSQLDHLVSSLMARSQPTVQEHSTVQPKQETEDFTNWLAFLQAFSPAGPQSAQEIPASSGNETLSKETSDLMALLGNFSAADSFTYDPVIDPSLLSMPTQQLLGQDVNPSFFSPLDVQTPNLIASPLASTSSFFDLPTPEPGAMVDPDMASIAPGIFDEGFEQFASSLESALNMNIDSYRPEAPSEVKDTMSPSLPNQQPTPQPANDSIAPVHVEPSAAAQSCDAPSSFFFNAPLFTGEPLPPRPSTSVIPPASPHPQPGTPMVLDALPQVEPPSGNVGTTTEFRFTMDPLTHVAASAPEPCFDVAPSGKKAPPAGTNSSRKAEVIRLARERVMQLSAELSRARMQLWETSLEGAVLAHLVKDPKLN